MTKTFSIVPEHGQVSALVAMGFYLIALSCILPALGILIGFPEVLGGDPYRLEVVALGVLTLTGFAASFIFGTVYAVASLLSGSGLWSRPLAVLHLGLHALGIGWLVVAFGGINFLDNPNFAMITGGLMILLGTVCLVINLLATSSRFNRWEPAQITVMTSLFWLGICTALGFALVIDQFKPITGADPLALIESHAVLALAGFVWLGLIGAALKLLNMFTVGQHPPGILSWIGCTVCNLVLFALVPVMLYHPQVPFSILAGGLLLGSLFYFADMLGIVSDADKGPDWPIVGLFMGILAGIALLAWGTLNMPIPASVEMVPTARVLGRLYVSIIVFGIFPLIAGSLAVRLVPFLVWRVRCAPHVGKSPTPTASGFINRRGTLSALICLTMGLVYLAAGQFLDHPAGTQIGALSLLVGTGWCFYAFLPAIQAFLLGVNPSAGKP